MKGITCMTAVSVGKVPVHADPARSRPPYGGGGGYFLSVHILLRERPMAVPLKSLLF